MKRRDFLKTSSQILLANSIIQGLSSGAFAAECEFTEHLEGFIPDNANAVISASGQFHHFHYLHVPEVILRNPPKSGWTTITSMMVPNLGIDPFFFRRREVVKQFHCHQVDFSYQQLVNIAEGRRTSVTAYIYSRRRKRAIPNHSFIFNNHGLSSRQAFTKDQLEIQGEASRKGLQKKRSSCLDVRVRNRGAVRVFNGKGFSSIRDLARLEELKGY